MAQVTQAELCRRIVENSPDAIIVANAEGNVTLWNGGAEAMFGHTAAETQGRSLDLIIPENLRARHWEGYRTVMATGVTKYGKDPLAVPAIRKDGSRISIEFSILMLKDGQGKVEGIAAFMRDVTARWQKEKATREKVAALEAKLKDLEQPRG